MVGEKCCHRIELPAVVENLQIHTVGSHRDPDDDDVRDPDDELDGGGGKMSFLEHLDELRKRLIASVYALIVGCVVSFIFVGRTQEFIMKPLWQLMPEGTKYSPGAMWADTRLWGRNLRGWKRVAIVSDADWLENAIKAFGWMMPGRVKVFETDDVDDAKEWLVDEDDD